MSHNFVFQEVGECMCGVQALMFDPCSDGIQRLRRGIFFTALGPLVPLQGRATSAMKRLMNTCESYAMAFAVIRSTPSVPVGG